MAGAAVSADARMFDQAYYERYYFDPQTRVVEAEHTRRLGAFVSSYLQYLRLPVRRVLDVGCGTGLWKAVIEQHFPQAQFTGVEYSAYLCERYGWQRGSVLNYTGEQPFDLVICQGVLPYLSASDARKAIHNLGRLCHGALYLEAVTQEDWDEGVIDETVTDPGLLRHPQALYRRGLAPYFRGLGGGLWLSHQAEVPLFALECADTPR